MTAAARLDDYSGFGSTFNPKFTGKFTPTDWLMFRASYNTGFRVPTFNQIFNGTTESPNPGNTLVDPTTCPGGTVSATPGCEAITPDTLSGGNLEVGPETSEQYSVGVVFRPAQRWSASVDFWSIAVDDTIGALTLSQALANIDFLDPARFQRDPDGGYTFCIQNESPGIDKESNWLPAPKGPFQMFLRLYWPKPDALNGTWKLRVRDYATGDTGYINTWSITF